MYQFSVPYSIHCSLKGWENVRFELGSERVKTKTMAAEPHFPDFLELWCKVFLQLYQILLLTDCSWVLVRRLFDCSCPLAEYEQPSRSTIDS